MIAYFYLTRWTQNKVTYLIPPTSNTVILYCLISLLQKFLRVGNSICKIYTSGNNSYREKLK